MKDQLEDFIRRVPNLDHMPPKEMVALFSFFVTELAGDPFVQPRRIRECYEAALLSPPGNISDVISKSKFFVSTTSGLLLQRAVRNRIAESITPAGRARDTRAPPKTADPVVARKIRCRQPTSQRAAART
jgi:hypothetical protein